MRPLTKIVIEAVDKSIEKIDVLMESLDDVVKVEGTSKVLVDQEWFDDVSELLLDVYPSSSCAKNVVCDFTFSNECEYRLTKGLPKHQKGGRLSINDFDVAEHNPFYQDLLRIFLSQPKDQHGHVCTKTLVSLLRKEQQKLWETRLSPPAQILYSLCFHHWMAGELLHAESISLDELWAVTTAWEREKVVLNTFQYPAKVFYNECLRHYKGLQRPFVRDDFIVVITQMMGSSWNPELTPYVDSLYEAAEQRQSFVGLVFDIVSSAQSFAANMRKSATMRSRPIVGLLPRNMSSVSVGFEDDEVVGPDPLPSSSSDDWSKRLSAHASQIIKTVKLSVEDYQPITILSPLSVFNSLSRSVGMRSLPKVKLVWDDDEGEDNLIEN